MAEELSWVSSQLLEALNAAPQTLQIEVHLFVTRPSEKSPYGNLNHTPSRPLLPHEFLTHESVTLELRKPDIKHSLRQKVEGRVGSTIVAGKLNMFRFFLYFSFEC